MLGLSGNPAKSLTSWLNGRQWSSHNQIDREQGGRDWAARYQQCHEDMQSRVRGRRVTDGAFGVEASGGLFGGGI